MGNEAQDDVARLTRIKRLSILKRDKCISSIRAINTLAERCIESADHFPQLSLLLEDIQQNWPAIIAEDDALLNCLIDLNEESEYSVSLVAEMRDLVAFARSVGNRFSEYPLSEASAHAGSRISVNVHDLLPNDPVVEQNDARSIAVGRELTHMSL